MHDGRMTGSVKVVDPASPPPLHGPGAFDGDLVILPHDLDGDRGIYSDRLITTLKALRAEGINARWLQDEDQRRWSGERSAIVALWLIPWIVGIASAAGWSAITKIIGQHDEPVKLKIGYRKDSAGGEERWIELEGSSADVAAELERLNPWLPLAAPSDPDVTAASSELEPRTPDE